MKKILPLITFNVLYITLAGLYFARELNFEFVIYVAVIVFIMTGVFATWSRTLFPSWQLWLLSFWGLMHVLGGAISTTDGVLFAYRIYPFLDLGGEFYILKYDQLVHAYLYGVIATMAYHLLHSRLPREKLFVLLTAILAATGVGGLNEIMEFLISLNLANGVGGYNNTMLDMVFNLGGALVAGTTYAILRKEE